MGRLGKRLARMGAVGGTARFAANWYHFLSEKYKKEESEYLLNTEVLISSMILARYNPAHKDPRLFRDGKILSEIHTRGMIESLCQLCVLILVVEAKFAENDAEIQSAFVDVIAEELIAKGVPKEYAVGSKGENSQSVALLLDYLPSIEEVQKVLLRGWI